MASNPKSALRALLDAPRKLGAFTVYPLTLQRAAALDALDSPFTACRARPEWTLLDMVLAAYVMTRTPEQIDELDFADGKAVGRAAVKWANFPFRTKRLTIALPYILERLRNEMELAAYLVPETPEGSQKTAGRPSSNGWLAQLAWCAVEQFGTSLDDALRNVPLAQIILLRRQKQYNDARGGVMTLEDKEFIDEMERKA